MSNRQFKYSPNISSDYYEVLEELADELVYNYLANSFGDIGGTDVDYEKITDLNSKPSKSSIDWIGIDCTTFGEYCNERRKQRRRCRNIMIIGAGASFDSYNSIPLGRQLVTSFSEIFVNKITSIPFLKDKYEHEMGEVKKLLKGELDFENFLYLLSTFFVKQETLREEIKEHTGFRYCPSLFYEICAHLLKHSFLDAIINFNFDEILDQSIREEMGKESYHFVLSDGHTLRLNDLIVDGRIKAPIYIKPHGTFSHKSSLRFTKRHYLDLPLDIQEMLKGLLSGYRGEGKEVQRINLICVGFDLASIEFNDIINNYLAPSSRIYHFLYNANKTNSILKEDIKKNTFEKYFTDFLKRSLASGSTFDTIYKPINLATYSSEVKVEVNQKNTKLTTNDLTTQLAEIFSNLWRTAFRRFNEFNRPRSIGRHEITSYFFYDSFFSITSNKKSDVEIRETIREYYDESPKYFRDRVMVEIAIELLRNNGNIDIIELLKGRTGYYFNKYLDACKNFSGKIREKNSIYDFLYEFTPSGKKPESFKDNKELQQTKIIFRINKLSNNEKEIFLELQKNFEKPFEKTFKAKGIIPSKEFVDNKRKEVLEDLITKIKSGYDKYKIESELGVTILLYLLKSNFLSSKFRENLLNNYEKTVYNGLSWKNGRGKYQFNLLIDELFRLFAKTNKNSFYNIQSKINDSSYKLWESYNVKNILHTNLLLSTDFRARFNNKNWDCLLAVFDTGDTIKSLFSENFEPFKKSLSSGNSSETVVTIKEKTIQFFEELRKKTIVVLCSMETVEQIHLLKNEGYAKLALNKDAFFKDKFEFDKNQNQTVISNALSRKENPSLSKEKYKIEILIEEHKKYICNFLPEENEIKANKAWSDNDKSEMIKVKTKITEIINKCLTIVLVPFWEHNQHCSIFLKSVLKSDEVLKNAGERLIIITNENDKKAFDISTILNIKLITPKDYFKYIYLFEGGYHMYRRGFSNSLSPIRLGNLDSGSNRYYVRQDIDKVLLFFFNVLCRGITYQVQNASLMKYEPQFIVHDLVYYRSWNSNEFFDKMQMFLGNLYLSTRIANGFNVSDSKNEQS